MAISEIHTNRFHSLNALKFIALMMVFVSIVGSVIPSDSPVVWLRQYLGNGSMHFFMVLTSFLITFTLLSEKEVHGRIDLRKFYWRRILSIWPLFFLFILIFYGLYIGRILLYGEKIGLNWMLDYGMLRVKGYWPSWKWSFLGFENYLMIIENWFSEFGKRKEINLTALRGIWFLSMQQHFYLIFPLILKKVKQERLPMFFLIFGVLSILSKIVLIFFKKDLVSLNNLSFDMITNLDSYAIGAYLGFVFFNRRMYWQKKSFEINYLVKISLILTGIAYYFTGNIWKSDWVMLFNQLILSFLSCVIIFFYLSPRTSLKISEYRLVSKLGKMSYSFYLSQFFVIYTIFNLFIINEIRLTSIFNVLVFSVLCLFLTLVVSLILHRMIERPILKIKKSFRLYH